MLLPAPLPTLFPYTTLFRSADDGRRRQLVPGREHRDRGRPELGRGQVRVARATGPELVHATGQRERVADGHDRRRRSEEHTSELQSPYDLVCRLLLEKKNLS